MIDFSQLTDDQLITLIQSACAEAVNRGTAVEAAARNAMLTEAEKAQIAAQAAQRAADELKQKEAARIAREAEEKVKREAEQQQAKEVAEQQQQLWAKKKALACQVVELLGEGWALTVWERDGEKRVYLDKFISRRDQPKISYFHTGNSYNAPGSIKIEAHSYVLTNELKEKKEAVLEICKQACKAWKSLKNLACDEACKVEVGAEVGNA